MNDLLRLISKSLQPFGYHVRRYKAPNILKTPGLQNTLSKSQSRTLPDNTNFDHMIVYLRTCARDNRNIDTTERVTGPDRLENTLRCIRSLVKSINTAHDAFPDRKIELIALDDRSDAQPLEKIKQVLKTLKCSWDMRQTVEQGQGTSLHEQFSDGRGKNALLYFCEDDYLHEENAVQICWDFYRDIAQKFGTHSLIYPQEHAVLYSDHYPSYLIAGKDRHWRTMHHATHTFITHGHVVKKYWDYFENTKYVGIKKHRKKGSEARTTNKLFKHIPGFSPLKPAAVHLQFEETLPPLYDWRPLWDDNAA